MAERLLRGLMRLLSRFRESRVDAVISLYFRVFRKIPQTPVERIDLARLLRYMDFPSRVVNSVGRVSAF